MPVPDHDGWAVDPMSDDQVGPVVVQLGRRTDGTSAAAVIPKSVGRLPAHALEVVSDLQRLGLAIQDLQHQVPEFVSEARSLGVSWAVLGWCLGLTGEAVRLRYAAELDS